MSDGIRQNNSAKKMMIKSSELSLHGEDHNVESNLDSAIFQLEMVHIELDKLSEKENDEIILVEQKYKRAKQQCFDKRCDIIANIPDFWFNVFTSHPDVCHILYEDDEDCLHYLHKLEVETSDNIKSGYSIKLYFNENPYFRNDVLVKEFFYKQGNFSSVSSKIDWKKSQQQNKETKTGKKRSHQPQQTFFGWFSNNDDATNDVIAEIIKDDIWVNALQYYLVPDPDMEINDEEESSDSSEDNVFQEKRPCEGTSK